MRGVRRGCVRLKGAIIGIDDADDSTFTITVDQKTFHFQGKLICILRYILLVYSCTIMYIVCHYKYALV